MALALEWPAHAQPSGPYRKIKAVDADNHTVLLNRPGIVTLVIVTSEESQNGAREAGKAMYPFQGRPDFQLMVVVDLRDSMATWAPSIATSQMRSSLDEEGVELKPYFLKNGNKSNPRNSSHVIPDFRGTVCPQLGWDKTSDKLRGNLFAGDGREVQHWDTIEDMAMLHNAVRSAIADYVEGNRSRAAAAAKMPGTRGTALSPLLPPLPEVLPDPGDKN